MSDPNLSSSEFDEIFDDSLPEEPTDPETQKFLYSSIVRSNDRPDLGFTTLNGEPIQPVYVIVDNEGKITRLIDYYDENDNPVYIERENFRVYKDYLRVPGVGFLPSGTFVMYDNKEEYQLLFGWHTNVSNQTIYSWYLNPLHHMFGDKEIRKPRTLYKEMIDKIDLICFYRKGGIYEGYRGQ